MLEMKRVNKIWNAAYFTNDPVLKMMISNWFSAFKSTEYEYEYEKYTNIQSSGGFAGLTVWPMFHAVIVNCGC